MRGPDGVRDAIAELLREVVPAKSDALREAFALTRRDFADIEHVSSGEIPDQQVGNMGDVYVEVVNPRLMPGMQWVDFDQGYPVFRLRYSCRLFVWALGANWPSSINRRDNAVNVVRQSIFEYPTLSTTPGDTGMVVHWDTYTEEYGTPVRTKNNSGRSWTGAMCSIDMWSEETMRQGALRPPIGSNEQTSLGTIVLGPNEPLPVDLPEPGEFTPIIDTTTEAITP